MILPYQTTQRDIPQHNGYKDSTSVLMMEAAASSETSTERRHISEDSNLRCEVHLPFIQAPLRFLARRRNEAIKLLLKGTLDFLNFIAECRRRRADRCCQLLSAAVLKRFGLFKETNLYSSVINQTWPEWMRNAWDAIPVRRYLSHVGKGTLLMGGILLL
jgi:hypothetical protein